MDTKKALLQAAGEIVAAGGSRTLTLEAVAARAGISKGGLLYHFPSKSALIAGMVAQAVEAFGQALAAAEASSGDWLEGYVEATLADLDQGEPLSGVLTAVAEDPGLLEPFRQALARWYQRAEADYGSRALPLLLALDGLWFHLQVGTLPAFDRSALAQNLRALAREARK
jgi:AcrR family transcriptional regulator